MLELQATWEVIQVCCQLRDEDTGAPRRWVPGMEQLEAACGPWRPWSPARVQCSCEVRLPDWASGRLSQVTERPGKEDFCSPPYAHYEVPPTFYRSAMLLKPQLGLGAMSRLPSAKSRILIATQRSSVSAIHPPGPTASTASLYSSDPAGNQTHNHYLLLHFK